MKAIQTTARYGATAPPGRSNNCTRTVETAALRQLPPEEQRELDAVSAAIQTTARYRNGALRIKLIDLIYWRGTHSLTGAALAIHVSTPTARLWHNGFIELVDAYMRIL